MTESTTSDDLTAEEAEAIAQERASLETSLQLLWEGEPEAGRGPKRSLRLDQIVSTAVEIADEEGLDAVSMRRLARELGVGTMSLYRYVPDKNVLLNLMINHVFALEQRAEVGDEKDWRAALRERAYADRGLYQRHFWLVSVNWNRPVIGPNLVDSMEHLLEGITGVPLTDQEKTMLLSALDAYVLGSVRQEIQSCIAAQEAGLTDHEFWYTQLPYLERAMESGRYPVMAQMDENTWDGNWDQTFEMGIAFILDGIAAEIARRNHG